MWPIERLVKKGLICEDDILIMRVPWMSSFALTFLLIRNAIVCSSIWEMQARAA
jgi:hypothetical protein